MANEHVTSHGYTFSQHMALAAAWCRWNGTKGTEKQALQKMRMLSAPVLLRMLTERGAPIPIGCEASVIAVNR
jgi:hypothetical protein